MDKNYSSQELSKLLYERSKQISIKQDACLMYQASLMISVLQTKVDQLLCKSPDDELHG